MEAAAGYWTGGMQVHSRRGLVQVGMVVLANNRKQGLMGTQEQLHGSWLLAALSRWASAL